MSAANENDVTGRCYCGEVRFLIPRDVQPLLSGYCHCVGCRQAHAAPVYQVAWVPSAALEITQGRDLLKWYTRSQVTREFLRRYFCTNCGTKVFNSFEGPFGDQQISAAGVFPTLFDDQSMAQSERWAPSVHMHCEESLLDLTQLNDGLPKLPKGADAVV